jgi:hypothetical protein
MIFQGNEKQCIAIKKFTAQKNNGLRYYSQRPLLFSKISLPRNGLSGLSQKGTSELRMIGKC